MNFLLSMGLEADDVYFLILAILAVVMLVVYSKSYANQNSFALRVMDLQERRAQLKAQIMAPRKRTKKAAAPEAGINIIRIIVSKLNLLQKSQIGKMTHLLVNAGYRSKDAVFIFAFFQLICPPLMLGLALFAANIDYSNPFLVKWKIFFVLGSIYFGLKLPTIMVVNKRNKRYEVIVKGLSDTLDLMMICAEAGLSLAASLDRVGKELANTYPELSEEMSLTSIELGFLPDRKKALNNLADRVDMPEMRGIAGVLIQTEKYGTPVAQALRVLAAEFREQRMLRAEQKAARLPAIMTIPMMIFILPTLFVVILTPIIIRSIANFASVR